jgi:predicted TIM-barrel fold metal-dependent hydrolase
MSLRPLLVDIHSHIYLPRFVNLLRSRTTAPFIFNPKNEATGANEERLVILKDEPSTGRPFGPQYWDRNEKLAFMDKHEIDISVVSMANPWLDWLPPSTASTLASSLNNDLEEYCATAPPVPKDPSLKRLYGLGVLPLVPSIDVANILSVIDQISNLSHLRGVIISSQGLGNGLDDDRLEPVWAKLAEKGLLVFLHPHYGVGDNVWGQKDNGHVLPLALGFTFETTIAITRLILAGVLDRHPNLSILLAHSGGTLPQLSSRLASCIDHDPVVASRLKHNARWYLGRLLYDSISYGAEELEFVSSAIGRADRFTRGADSYSNVDSQTERKAGSSRILWGTDHPFFPPIKESTEKWESVVANLRAVNGVPCWDDEEKEKVQGENAYRLFTLRR